MLRREIEQVVGEYLFDCTNFRTDDKDDLLRQIYEMTDRRFALADHLLRTKPGISSRWSRWAPTACTTASGRTWTPSTAGTTRRPPRDAILDYHKHVDGLVAGLLEHADDDTAVLVVSDHGAKRMDGGIRINEWLRREGLLRRCASRTREASSLAESASTGRGRPPGARAATTPASS